MRIAQVAPLWEPVPAPRYGAVESHVADLARELAGRGHQVTVFASGDSTVEGLHASCRTALNHDPTVVEPEAIRLAQMRQVLDRAENFDVIHCHLHSNSGTLGLLALSSCTTPVVHTIHCFRNADNAALFDLMADEAFIAISESQRASFRGLQFVATIPHGIDVARAPFRPQPDRPLYLAFLGRLRPEKGAHVAIEIARRAGLALRIAGRVKDVDAPYFDRQIRPHVDGEAVRYLGELGYHAKMRLLGGAYATLVPTTLPEPFGLVTAESLAVGTPVVGVDAGAIRELVDHGRTGLIGGTTADLPQLIDCVSRIDRNECRVDATRRFALSTMIDRYEDAFERVLVADRSRQVPPHRHHRAHAHASGGRDVA